MDFNIGLIVAASVVVVAIIVFLLAAIFYRVVVPTNEVHIVQRGKKATSYGSNAGSNIGSNASENNGNTYYAWPSWFPYIGVKVGRLPLSVFQLPLDNYAAYDKGRVPFVIDIMAFFRIVDSNVAAQRISRFEDLKVQLEAILQSAARTILAKSEIEEILEGRSQFGEMFTNEVDEQLLQWGVKSVKCIELMDIRDAVGSQVIHNIMQKKQSLIAKESRIEVAKNIKEAELAEIDAQREVQVRAQAAEQQIGIQTALKEKEVGISKEQALQSIKEQARITAEKDMMVKQVQEVRNAEILRDVAVVKADEQKQTDVITAEGEKQKTVITAEGQLESERRIAEAILLKGSATAEAEKLLQLAPVEAQITLAKEIGTNDGYQKYLVEIRQVEMAQAVGIEQAKALAVADLKVLVNSGDTTAGINSVSKILSPAGGTSIGGMLEGLAQTPAGKALLDKFLAQNSNDSKK